VGGRWTREKRRREASQFLGAVGTPLLYAAGAVVLAWPCPATRPPSFRPDGPDRRRAGDRPPLGHRLGMLPLTGLVFSLAFVMVQFSATAYSPAW